MRSFKMSTHYLLILVILTVLDLTTDKISAADNPLTCTSEWEENSEATCTVVYDPQESNNTFRWIVHSSQGQLTALCSSRQGCAYNNEGLTSVVMFPGGNNLTITSLSRFMTTVSFNFVNSGEEPWRFSLPVFVKPVTPSCWDPMYGGPDMLIRCKTSSVYPRGKCVFHVQGASSQDSEMLTNITYSHAVRRRSNGLVFTECDLHIPWNLLHAGDKLQFRVEMFPSVPNGQEHSVFSDWTAPVVYEPYSVINFTANNQSPNTTVRLQSRVIFHCKATGNPEPTLYIVKLVGNSTSLVHQRGLVTETYESMFVTGCDATSHYECRVSNGLGAKKEVFVSVQEPLRLRSYPSAITVYKSSHQFVARFPISGCPILNYYKLTYLTGILYREVQDWEVEYNETYFEMTLKTSVLGQIAMETTEGSLSSRIRFSVVLDNGLQPLNFGVNVDYIDNTFTEETTTSSDSKEDSSSGWSASEVAALVMPLLVVLGIIGVCVCIFRVSRKKDPHTPIRPTFYPPVPTAGQRRYHPANRPANYTPEDTDNRRANRPANRTNYLENHPASYTSGNTRMQQIRTTRDTSPIVPTGVSSNVPNAPPIEMDNPSFQNFSPPPSYNSVVATDVNASSGNGVEDAHSGRTVVTDGQGSECPPPSYASVQASLERPPSYPGEATYI